MGSPFPPFQHLLCCLPPSSASLLPAGYARLLTEKESPLVSYFPAEFCSDLNGKKKEYEAVILLPFLEEERIIDAIATSHCNDLLSEEERKRNTFSKELLFYWKSEGDHASPSLNTHYFPLVSPSHCHCESVENWESVFSAIRERSPQSTRTATFPSLMPCYGGIRHSIQTQKPDRKGREKTHLLIETQKTIIEADLSNLPFAYSLDAMRRVGKEFIGQIMEYDYPRHKLGLIAELFSYEFGCRMSGDPNGDREKTIRVYVLSKEQRTEVRERLKELQRKALNGNPNEPHDFGGLDIDGNMLLLRLRPIFNLSRQQKSRSILPFFSSQLIDIPMCLARPIKSLNLLGGSRSLSQFATDHLNVGDPVVYIGPLNVGTRPIRGSLGKITEVKDTSIIITCHVHVPPSPKIVETENWYDETAVRARLRPAIAGLLDVCLGPVFCYGQKGRISVGLDLKPNFRGSHVSTLVRVRMEKPLLAGVLPAYYYSYVSLDAEKNDTPKRVEYSATAVDIIEAYFRRFGDKLAKAISVEKSGKTFVDYAKLRVGKEGVSEAEFGGRNAQLGEEQNRGLFGVRGRHGLLGRFCMRATDECRNSGYFGRREGSGGGV